MLRTDRMNTPPFSAESYGQQLQQADRELAAFMVAVGKLYGPEQARISAQDWIDEALAMDSSPWLGARNWRPVTIAASVRLAHRLNAAQRGKQNDMSNDSKLSKIPRSNCSGSPFLS